MRNGGRLLSRFPWAALGPATFIRPLGNRTAGLLVLWLRRRQRRQCPRRRRTGTTPELTSSSSTPPLDANHPARYAGTQKGAVPGKPPVRDRFTMLLTGNYYISEVAQLLSAHLGIKRQLTRPIRLGLKPRQEHINDGRGQR